MKDPVERADVIDALSWGNEWEVMGFTFIDKDDAIRQIKSVPSTQPEADEWCADCKEYDHDKHCCPRWNRVIRTAMIYIAEKEVEQNG